MSESKLSEFYMACRIGDLVSVDRLLNHLSFYDLNQLEPNGSTALHAAAFYGHIDIVRRLVDHGAIVRTLQNKYKLTPAQETKNEEIKRLLEPDATYQPRKRFINDDHEDKNNKQETMSISSTTLFSPVSVAPSNTKTKNATSIDEEERLEWLDAYDSAHRIAQENHEYMRKWLTKIPLTNILRAINNDYIDNPSTELNDKHRVEIRTYIEVADSDDDPRHLVYAYTLETNFYRQLNRDLAQRGSDFRFEDHDVKKYRDDEPPSGFGQYLFAAVIIHHPIFAPFYYCGTTYRGMNLSQADFNEYVPGARILTRSFLSTSKSVHPVSVYLQFNALDIVPVICIYRTIQSLPATSLAIAKLSAIPIEDEVLIFPFVAFRVMKVDFASFYFPERGTATIMFLDQITDKPEAWPLCGLEEGQQQEHVKNSSINMNTSVIMCQEATREIQSSCFQPIICLYEKYRQKTDEYIQSCISRHSHVSCLHDLGVDINQSANYKCLLTDPFLVFTEKELEWLRLPTNVDSFSIPLEPATYFLMRISQQEMADIDLESDKSSKLNLTNIQNVIGYEHCCVIFGTPGAGKTTLARWITLMTARAFSQILNENLSSEINEVRLPILVHLSEVVQILELHSNWTLLDCLGHLIWYENGITNNFTDQKTFTHDYICQQHSIIILDGLDEIIDISARNRIIELIYEFIQAYVLNNDTAFYQTMTEVSSNDDKLGKVSGNQLIILSRWFAGFKDTLIGKIPCYTFTPLSFDNATQFIHRWFREIAIKLSLQNSISSLTVGVINADNWDRIAKELIESLTTQVVFQQLVSNSSLLAAICGLVTIKALINPFSLLDKRIVFYHFTSALILHRVWKMPKNSTIVTEKEFECLLIDIAAYIHQHSSIGFIEDFDMRLKCRSSLKILSAEKENTRWNRQIINNFVFKASINNIGLIVPRRPDLYRFLFPAFQHYFMCLSIVRMSTVTNNDRKSSIELVVSRILYYITDSRYREPLLLALSYISWQWISSDIEFFYEELLKVDTVRFNRQLPLTAMLLMTALPELHSLPPIKIVYSAFNQFLTASTTREWLTRFPIFIEHFVNSLNNLSPIDATLWLTNYLSNNSDTISIRAIVRVFLRLFHHTRQIPLFLRPAKETNSFTTVLQSHLSVDDDHSKDEDNVFAIDRLLVAVSIFDFEMLPNNSMRQYLLESNVPTEGIFPSVLAAIIALYGGLYRSTTVSNQQCLSESIVFSPSHIHRNSALTKPLIECLNGNQQNFANMLHEREREDISNDTVDLFIAWLCLEGVGRPFIYEKFITWPAFWLALARLSRLALYLSEYYYARLDIPSNCLDDQYTLSSLLFGEANQIIEQYVHSISQCNQTISQKLDLFPFVQSIASAMCRLMFPGGERSLFVSQNVSRLGMLNLPVSNEFQQLLMSDEYSSKTFSRRLANFMQLMSPPFLPKHLHIDMDDLADQQQFQYETRPMLLHRHHSSFPLAVLPRPFQPLFACLLDSSSNRKDIHNHLQLPFACLLGEVVRTMSRQREGSARYNLLLAILRVHFEEYQLANCFIGLVHMTAAPSLRSFFVPFDAYLAEQDQRPPFNLILDDEQQEDFLLYTVLTEEVQRVQEAQHECNDTTANDLKLYTSAISLAALIAAIDQRRKDKRQLIVNDDEAIKTALLINDPILRLHALTVTWQFEQTMNEQIDQKSMPETALNLLLLITNNDQIPLELHAFVFLIFWLTFGSIIPTYKSKQELGRLLDRLESCAESVPTDIEQAVCETLELSFDHNEFPFLRPRIYRFIKKSSWSDESDIVSQVLGLRSPSLISCMRKWSTLQSKSSTITFLASMYLMQLSIDANTLPMWLKQQAAMITLNDDSNDIEKELVSLLDMSDQPETLTLDVATRINRLLNENKTKTTTNFDLLEQRLARCLFVQSSALPIIAEWCQYKNDRYFYKFAYYAALLSVQRYPTGTALEICCDLLQNDDDDFRQRANEIIATIYQSSSRLGVRGLACLLKLALPSRHAYSAFVYERISKIDLRIDSFETLELLLSWERKRIKTLTSTKNQLDIIELNYSFSLEGNDLNVSLLQAVYVGLLVPDVRNQFFAHAYAECRKTLVMLDEIEKNDEHQQQQLYLVELVLYASRYWRDLSPGKMSAEENLFIDGLIELLAEQHLRRLPILSKVIVKALIVNRPDLPYIPRGTSIAARQCIRNILKKVAEANENDSSLSDDAIATMIRHYYHGNIKFSADTEEELQLLSKLLVQSYTSFSPMIIDAAACALVRSQCFLSDFNTNLFDLLRLFNGSYLRLYRTLILLADDSVTGVTIRLITVQLIKKYDDELFPLFVQELCEIVTKFNTNLSLSQPFNNSNHFTIAISVINEMSAARFREVVEHQIDESFFKRGLYCTSKQLNNDRRLVCLQILTRLYGELTDEVNDMFYCAMWEKASDRQIACACISFIQRVASRSIVEQLFTQLITNGSRQRRYLSGMLLVQLARCDEVSTFEVQRKLTEAIDSPLSMLGNTEIDLMKESENRIKRERLDQALFNLLMQLSFIPNQVSNEILSNSDYRIPDITNFEEEFSHIVDADCCASCIVLPFCSNSTQESISDID